MFTAASSGTAEVDFERLSEILNNVKDLKFICLDVANGYSQHFVEYLRRVRAAFPTHTIIVSILIFWVKYLSLFIKDIQINTIFSKLKGIGTVRRPGFGGAG